MKGLAAWLLIYNARWNITRHWNDIVDTDSKVASAVKQAERKYSSNTERSFPQGNLGGEN